MGAESWFYYVDYQSDISKCLQELRQREFKAGRYNPADPFPTYPVNPNHAPGCKHSSIDEAKSASGASGTRSILDLGAVGESPDYGVVGALDAASLMEFFGTDKPTREMIESKKSDLFEDIERGQGIYIIVYKDEKPTEIFFAGYSFD